MEGNSERQGRDDRQRQQDRPPSEDISQGNADGDRQSSQKDEAGGTVAQVDDLVGVPLVAEDQDREEDQGREHRQ
jgi:hypothetical protein